MPRMSANSPSAEPFRATDEQPARRLGGATGRGFMPGQSGNPAGRAKGLEASARRHTEAAIAALVKALENPRERVAAAVALLDRGWGRPRQIVETPEGSHLHFHLEAAMRVSAQLQAEPRRVVTIEQEPQSAPSGSLLDAPLPLE
jgi:hypothetical protein